MPDYGDILDRVRERFPAPELPLVEVYRLRDRRRRRQRIAAGAVGVAVSLVGIAWFASAVEDREPDQPVSPTPTLPVVDVVATDEERADLYQVDPSTGQTTELLIADASQVQPELSPDGTRVVFQGKSDALTDEQSNQLFTLEADGTVRQLTDLPGAATSPSWSPDGTRVAFVKSPEQDIYVIDADGTDLRAVTETPADERDPHWSPDGSHIVFESGSEDDGEIWIVSVDEGSLSELEFPGGAAHPVWSPDGAWIAFRGDDGRQVSELERNDHDIWLIHPDDTGLHRLVPGEDVEFEWADESPDGHYQGDLDWSPSGGSIAFTEVHCDCIHIFDVATGEETELEMDIGNGYLENVSWGPDGSILLAVNLYD